MSLTRLASRIQAELHRSSVQLVEFPIGDDPPKLTYEREMSSERRYVRCIALDDTLECEYSILFGSFRNKYPSENFDARRVGDLEYTVKLIVQWLIDCCKFDELPVMT